MADKVYYSHEYKHVRGVLKEGGFPKGAKSYLTGLQTLLGPTGPEATSASVLDRLRKRCKSTNGKNGEAKTLLALSGDGVNAVKRAAAFKFARHLYLIKKRGSQSVWIHTAPKAYKKWPSDELSGATGAVLEAKLQKTARQFTDKQMRDLQACTQEAMAWANKAVAICTATKGVGKETAETLFKRWFADEFTKDEEIPPMIKKLADGFKLIANAANGCKLVLTDAPTIRGKAKFSTTNAMVATGGETIRAIYIEGAFFDGADKPLSGADNWARIIVHELSHMLVKTEDIRYRHYKDAGVHKGLKPTLAGGFSTERAMANADSWAFFAADAAGKLTKDHLKYLIK
jgi:hypothetical protein